MRQDKKEAKSMSLQVNNSSKKVLLASDNVNSQTQYKWQSIWEESFIQTGSIIK